MTAELLLDTGAFVALVDRGEVRHAACAAVLDTWDGLVLTTEAVITETLHLVGPGCHVRKICLEFFRRGAFLLVPSSRETLNRASALMEKYADVPMDFADATLVVLAEDVRTPYVFTLDHRGFSAYRWMGDRGFRIVPASGARE